MSKRPDVPALTDSLPAGLAGRLNPICDRFEALWQSGGRPVLEEFLPLVAEADRPALLRELLALEREYRGRRGETPTADEYRPRFPEYAALIDQAFAAPGAGPDAAPVPLALPGYEILGELGRGGMGVVYQARQLGFNRIVALKMILSGAHAGSDERDRFRTETEAVARLQHPNIVQVYEVGEHEGKPFFSMEFCSGGGLDRKLNGTPLPPAEAAQLIETLARAVHAAHQQNVVHRDLKPANVLLSADGSPKVTDFGLAKKLDEGGQTRTGAVIGTPSYMAPEQAGGKSKEIGPATDVYALGAILYEMLTGRPPFKAATPLDTLMLVLQDEPVPPRRLQSKTPRDLETICLKCLEKQAGRRYATAAELADDLGRWRRSEPVRARPVGRMERAVEWARRHPTRAAMCGLLLMVLGLIATAVVLVGQLFLQSDAYRKLQANVQSKYVGRDAEGKASSTPMAAGVVGSSPPSAPVVHFRDFIDRGSNGYFAVAAPEVPLAFAVVSTTPLKQVRLLGEDDTVLFESAPGTPTVEDEEQVHVRPGLPTPFRVVAVNDSGETDAVVTLKLPQRPFYTIVDRLESPRQGGRVYTPSHHDAEGRAVFDAVAEGHVVLRGRIFWTDPNDDRFQRGIGVRVYANDFQQIPVEVQPPAAGATECPCVVNVLLTRPTDNLIEVVLLGAPLAEGLRTECLIRQCTAPILGRRLHLVVIGVDVKDGDKLKAQALEAIGAKPPRPDGRIQAPPAFEEVVVYDPPAVGYVSKGQMADPLNTLRWTLDKGHDDMLADVTLIYFKCDELVSDGRLYLLSSAYEGDKSLRRSALNTEEVANVFSDAPGIHILMVDAKRVAGKSRAAEWDHIEGEHLGVFHSFWSADDVRPAEFLTLMQMGWPKAHTLGGLAKQVKDLCPPHMTFSYYLPRDFSELEFGGAP